MRGMIAGRRTPATARVGYPRSHQHRHATRSSTATSRLLAGALRTAIAELAGGHVTSIVDRAVADAAAARRAGTVAAVGRTRAAIEGLALDDLTLLVRALGHELHLANLAEQVHRLRRRRQRDDGTPLPESMADAVAHLRDGGVVRHRDPSAPRATTSTSSWC